MQETVIPNNPYLLLTPGPLSTSPGVRLAMLRDWCTWDADYKSLVQDIRARLETLASPASLFTSILMQGSGTFSLEACLGTVVPRDGKLLVLANGHYGDRLAQIASRLGIDLTVLDFGETGAMDVEAADKALAQDPSLTHVAAVHCETSTGMLNPVEALGEVVARHRRCFIVDAMSSFGGLPMDMNMIWADYLVSSANKCIQGVPGFGFVLARRDALEECACRARSLSLDLHAQWREMEENPGKWRYTSPTHAVHAFAQALTELEQEGGVAARHARYAFNHEILVEGMRELGFTTLLPDELQSPIITAFRHPSDPRFDFARLYADLKARGFVIYPGSVTSTPTFRIGNIGHVYPRDMEALVQAVQESMHWN